MSDKKPMEIHAAELKLLELYESDKFETVNRTEMETLRLSQHWENEPDIDGQWPSDVIEMIAEELEKAWIDTSRRDKRAVIAWARSQVDILDKVWAEREIENITNTIAGLIERREHLEGVAERLAKETNDDQD